MSDPEDKVSELMAHLVASVERAKDAHRRHLEERARKALLCDECGGVLKPTLPDDERCSCPPLATVHQFPGRVS